MSSKSSSEHSGYRKLQNKELQTHQAGSLGGITLEKVKSYFKTLLFMTSRHEPPKGVIGPEGGHEKRQIPTRNHPHGGKPVTTSFALSRSAFNSQLG